jgi:oligoendopeptidase F
MRDLPFAARQYVMSTAETASTFNELVIVDASLRDAATDSERLSLLDSKLQSATVYLMNIRARFMFDKAFYAARERGPLTVDELDALMLSAQKEAYCNALADDAYHPLFWASKLHFYLTRVPFYNFPYTFGFLFSSGIYDRALQEGQSFVSKYVALLRDTGSMDTEALVHKHLGVDLTQPDFWEAAVGRVLEDVDPFVELATPQA